jgi:hypothetical protein
MKPHNGFQSLFESPRCKHLLIESKQNFHSQMDFNSMNWLEVPFSWPICIIEKCMKFSEQDDIQ